MENLLVKLIGWKALVLHGDPTSFDRWEWLKYRLQPGSLRTLDAGCGSGAFTLYCSKIGNESTGLSFDERNNEVAAVRAKILGISNVRFIEIDLRQLDRSASQLGRFDQILCLETIEHIREDKKLLGSLSFLLKPGGKLFLTTPYKCYKHLLGDKLSETEDGGHVRWGYTHQEIKVLLNECGLEVLEEDFISGFVSQKLTNLLRITCHIIDPRLAWLILFPLRVLQVFDRPLTRGIGYPWLSIAVVASKPVHPPPMATERLNEVIQ